jgi:hypothetical protein
LRLANENFKNDVSTLLLSLFTEDAGKRFCNFALKEKSAEESMRDKFKGAMINYFLMMAHANITGNSISFTYKPNDVISGKAVANSKINFSAETSVRDNIFPEFLKNPLATASTTFSQNYSGTEKILKDTYGIVLPSTYNVKKRK